MANLDFGVQDEDLEDIFGPYGTVVEAHHVNDKFDPARKKGFAFVTFSTMEEAQAAVSPRGALLKKRGGARGPAREKRQGFEPLRPAVFWCAGIPDSFFVQ